VENPVPVQKGKVLLGLFNLYRFTLARQRTRFKLYSSVLKSKVLLGLFRVDTIGTWRFFPVPVKKVKVLCRYYTISWSGAGAFITGFARSSPVANRLIKKNQNKGI